MGQAHVKVGRRQTGFNRTLVELKLYQHKDNKYSDDCFNRTLVELKSHQDSCP